MNVIIITGASDGIGANWPVNMPKARGKDIALSLAARRLDKLQAVADQCRQSGAQVLARPTDVSDEAECRSLIGDTAKQFGRIDTLINNAGISGHGMLAQVPDLVGTKSSCA